MKGIITEQVIMCKVVVLSRIASEKMSKTNENNSHSA